MVPTVAVPTVQQASASLGSIYDPQVAQVNSEIAQLAPQQQTQQAALDQAKVNAFQDITNQANSRGMLFSGFSPQQQATYIGTKYLPAVANLQTSFNNQKNTLIDKINAINQARATQAQSIVNADQTAANNAAYKNAQLALSAQKAANSAANAANKPLSLTQLSSAISQGLSSVRGKDGYVSPQDYASAYSDWIKSGQSPATFDTRFGSYMNPKNGYYQYAKSQVA